MIEAVKTQVSTLLNQDNSGHGMEHINRVLDLSLRFAQTENADPTTTALIALLHDVDDYKLFSAENAQNLTNAKKILHACHVDPTMQDQVLLELSHIGYSKRLKGESPITIAGKIVSDADMCDALGVSGILRTYAYSTKHGKPFFDKTTFPIADLTAAKYANKTADSSVCHFFEKALKLKDLMLTTSGRQEAASRHQFLVDFLYHLFAEENAPEWTAYLDNYLQSQTNS